MKYPEQSVVSFTMKTPMKVEKVKLHRILSPCKKQRFSGFFSAASKAFMIIIIIDKPSHGTSNENSKEAAMKLLYAEDERALSDAVVDMWTAPI